jgi:hypothetical protein
LQKSEWLRLNAGRDCHQLTKSPDPYQFAGFRCELPGYLTRALRVGHFPQDLNSRNEAQVSFAIATAKGFEAMRRQANAKT